ncbi:HIT domain-containing protein [Candidatus Woesearchaeota archaeon]|nr:HIT domain-containing protein [Candidatus Woesearchaeota archaeon]
MSPEEIAQLQKDNCIFCKIIRGEIPSKKVYEDDNVVAILDINPARKGHVLVMPKEHFPILPLIPPKIFDKIFLATKIIAHGIRKAMLVNETTIFIANGAVAGQQSPHFLFHIFPRDKGDVLTNFNLQENPAMKGEQKSIEAPLKNNLNIMLSKILPSSNSSSKNDSSKSKESPKDAKDLVDLMAKKQELIAQILEEHDDVRLALIEDPISFKEQLKGNPKLEELFNGIDIETLSKQLSSSFKEVAVVKEDDAKEEKITNQNLESSDSSSSQSNELKPEVFLGEDPLKQRAAVFEYFNSKPKAKQLLISDPDYFIELLKNRPDVKELFVDVNIHLLSEKLKERGGDVDE